MTFSSKALDLHVPVALRQLYGSGRLPQGTRATPAAMHSHCTPLTILCEQQCHYRSSRQAEDC